MAETRQQRLPWTMHPLAHLALTRYLDPDQDASRTWDTLSEEEKKSLCLKLLTMNRRELANSDPLIPLLAQKEKFKKPNMALGVYKLSSPSMKVLNDETPLGRNGANELIQALNGAVKIFIDTHNDSYGFLSTYFKGAYFLVDMDAYNAGSEGSESIQDAFLAFHDYLNDFFSQFVETYIATHALGEEAATQLRTFAQSGLKVSFGLQAIEHTEGMEDREWIEAAGKARALAQVAMNETHHRITAPVGKGWEGERRSPLTFFSVENLNRDVQRIYGAILAKVKADPDRYALLFELKEGQLCIQDAAIMAQRKGKLDNYCPDLELQADLIAFFNLVNRFDAVNPYTAETSGQYFDRLPDSVRVLNGLDSVIADEGAHFEALRAMLKISHTSLEKSHRQCSADPLDAFRVNTRAVIYELMGEDEHWLIMGDHVGFSLRNFQAMQELAYRVYRTGSVQVDDLLTALDEPTRYLREIESKIRDVFPEAMIGGDGGDEVAIVIPRFHGDIGVVRSVFGNMMSSVRIAGYTLPPMKPEEAIVVWRYLDRFAESTHSGIKAFDEEHAARGSQHRAKEAALAPVYQETMQSFLLRSRYDSTQVGF